jgi:hypothetical protein
MARFTIRDVFWLTLVVAAMTTGQGCGRVGNTPAGNSDQATPEAVYATYRAAMLKGDWNRAWQCLTPRNQDHMVFELAFAWGMHGEEPLKPYFDYEAEAKKRSVSLDVAAQLTDEESRQFVIDSCLDKQSFYCAACQALADHLQRTLREGGPVRSVVVKGGRASGEIVAYVRSISGSGFLGEREHAEPYKHPVYFQRQTNGWLIDLPMDEEMEAWPE